MIIASETYIDELDQKTKLLENWLLEIAPLLKKKISTRQSRPKGRPQKQVVMEIIILVGDECEGTKEVAR